MGNSNVEVLNLDGKKFAVLPLSIYKQLVERLEDMIDIAECKKIMEQIENGEMETFPASVVNAILDGENKIKVFREYRGLTQAKLAQLSGLSVVMIKKLEARESDGSIRSLKAIAKALQLDLEDIIDND